jgi:hypothetical protein
VSCRLVFSPKNGQINISGELALLDAGVRGPVQVSRVDGSPGDTGPLLQDSVQNGVSGELVAIIETLQCRLNIRNLWW